MPPYRRLLTIFIPTVLLALIVATGILPASAETLVVTVREIRNDDGDIRVALYNSADNFLVDGQTAALRTVSAKAGEMVVVFVDLAPGTYAAAAFHDENGSGEFDTNFLGLPREGYGFSNGAQAILGPPDFEDAAVPLIRTVSETELSLTY